MAASKQLGIDFSVEHIKELLQAFVDARRESQATAKSLVKDAADVAKAVKSLQGQSAIKALSAATVSARPAQSVSTSLSGQSLKIDITVKGLMTATATSSSSSRGRGAGGAARSLAYPTGPRQQLSRLAGHIARARANGDDDALADLLETQARLTKRIQPRAKKNPIMDLIYTSRFGAGGAMPLVGKALDAAGGRNSPTGKALLGIGILGNAAFQLTKEFYDLSTSANNAVKGLLTFSNATGGSVKENAFLRGLAGGAGISTDDMAGVTKGLQGAITSDPYAMAIAAQMGVMNTKGPYGHQDWAGDEQKVATALRKLYQSDKSPNHENSLRKIRSLGQESLVSAFGLDDQHWNALISTANNGPTASDMAAANNQAAARNRLGMSAQNLLSGLAGNRGITHALDQTSDFMDALRRPKVGAVQPNGHPRSRGSIWGHYLPDVLSLKYLRDGISKAWHNDGRPPWQGPAWGNPNAGTHPAFAAASPNAVHVYRAVLEAHKREQEHASALVKNAEATRHLAQLLAAGRGPNVLWTGSYGNMTRQGVMPRQLDTGFVLNKYLNSKALHLSSF